MIISSKIAQLEGKEVIFKHGEGGDELKGNITRIYSSHNAFTAEYYNPFLDANASILVPFDDVAHVEGNLIIFKKE